MITTEQSKETKFIQKYHSSFYSKFLSSIALGLMFCIGVFFIWGLLTAYVSIVQFIQTKNAGFPNYPIYNSKHIQIDWVKWVRWSFAGFLAAIILYIPTKWLINSYGHETITLTNEGITIKKILRSKDFIPWDGILNTEIEKSNLFLLLFRKDKYRICIYTMSDIIKIESSSISDFENLSKSISKYCNKLNESVTNFGYRSRSKLIFQNLKKSKPALVGLILVSFFVSIAIFSAVINVITPINTLDSQLRAKTLFGFWNPNYFNIADKNKPPCLTKTSCDIIYGRNADGTINYHFLGTDSAGHDIFSRILFGSYYSLLIAVIATLISTFVGTVVGASSGFIGGKYDQIVERIIDIMNAMPNLPLLLLVSTAFIPLFTFNYLEGSYYIVVFSIFALLSWGNIARVLRSEVLSIKNNEFITAERMLGASNYRIIKNHIIPNIFSTVLIYFTIGVGSNIIAVATISFLGFGSQSTLVWGKDLSDAIYNHPTIYWWGPISISLCLFLFVFGINLLGDGLRESFDIKSNLYDF